MFLDRYYSSPHCRCLMSGIVCALMFTVALVWLAWTSPRVWAADGNLEYPTHREISDALAKIDARLASTEEYTSELHQAELRKRVLILEQAQLANARDMGLLMKFNWLLLAGVFMPYFRAVYTFYGRTERRRRRKDRAENDAEDEAEL